MTKNKGQADQQAADQQAANIFAGGGWLELTDASTGRVGLIDMAAVTHIWPGVGSRPNSDPAKQRNNGNEMGPVTMLGTIGGQTVTVLESLDEIAALDRPARREQEESADGKTHSAQ